MTTPLHILQHARGVDQYGRGKRYRNHYTIGRECDSFDTCEALVALGFMRDRGAEPAFGGMHVFVVTAEGDTAIDRYSPAPPKLTRSQKRYAAWAAADSGLKFGEWLRVSA